LSYEIYILVYQHITMTLFNYPSQFNQCNLSLIIENIIK